MAQDVDTNYPLFICFGNILMQRSWWSLSRVVCHSLSFCEPMEYYLIQLSQDGPLDLLTDP